MTARLALILISFLTLAACGGVDYGGPRWGGDRAPSAQVDGIALGSTYGNAITFSDAGYMSDAFLSVVNAEAGAARSWSNGRTGASGEVIMGQSFLQNVDYARGSRLHAPVGLQTRWMLEPAQGDYTTTSNTNVRLGASTSAPIVSTLDEGTVVEAVGSTRGEPWMLVARHGEVIGYMHTDFLDQREGGDVLLAGGTAREPVYCRAFEQRLSLRNGPRDVWQGTACRSPRGEWRVQARGGPGV